MADRIVQLKDEQDNNIFPIAADNPNIVAVDLVEEVPALNDFMLPVGSILTMGTDADPNTLYPGTTWEIFTTGWLKGVSASESAGLPVNEQLPAHKHATQGYRSVQSGGNSAVARTIISSDPVDSAATSPILAQTDCDVYVEGGHVQPAGKTVKIWIRTA